MNKEGVFMKKVLLIFTILFALITGCSKKGEEKKEILSPKISAPLLTIEKKKTTDVYEVSGNIVSKNPVNIVSKTMGTVVSVNAFEGDRVSKGKLIIQIDSPEVTAMLNRTQASIEEAQKALMIAKANEKLAFNTLKRYENLYNEQAISQQEFEIKETAYLVAKSEVERLENVIKQAEAERERVKGMQSYLFVYAPLSGVITKKYVNPGTNVLPGMQLLTIEPENDLRVEVDVDEKVYGFIKQGMILSVYVETLGREFKGVVSEIVPAIDPQSRTFRVKLDLPKDKSLAIGLYANVKIGLGTKESIFIPKTAIYTKGQLDYVYVVGKDNKLSLRLVRTGSKHDNMVEILSGLNEGERIVKVITESVQEGAELQQ